MQLVFGKTGRGRFSADTVFRLRHKDPHRVLFSYCVSFTAGAERDFLRIELDPISGTAVCGRSLVILDEHAVKAARPRLAHVGFPWLGCRTPCSKARTSSPRIPEGILGRLICNGDRFLGRSHRAGEAMSKLPDAKWLDLLNASGWKMTAIAAGCATFLVLASNGIAPSTPFILSLMWVGLLLSGFLAASNILEAAYKTASRWGSKFLAIRKHTRQVAKYIPHMTDKEKEIIGYLLAHNQKGFTCADDFGYAATLRGRGIVVVAAKHGQVVDFENVPARIPDHIWDVLEKNKDQFPYARPDPGEREPHPWRVGWQARL